MNSNPLPQGSAKMLTAYKTTVPAIAAMIALVLMLLVTLTTSTTFVLFGGIWHI